MQKEILTVIREHDIDIDAFFQSLSLEKQQHSQAVSQMTASLLTRAQQDDPLTFGPKLQPAMLGAAALYHDIGFVLIPHRLANKREDLTAPEFRVLQQHTTYGGSILERYRKAHCSQPEQDCFWASAAEIALGHHERWDGKGYPFGQMATTIAPAARAAAITGSFDNMVRGSFYRMALPPEYALLEIIQNAGTQFDPILAETFRTHFEAIIAPTGVLDAEV